MQAINVFMGGTLHQDIGCSHKHIISGHKLETFPNHLLAFDQAIAVNSFHHQAVKELAPGLIAVARHLDGTIEAFVHRSLPIIGIQWHPELLPDSRETKPFLNVSGSYRKEKLLTLSGVESIRMGFVETPGVPDDFFDSEKRLPAEDAFDFFARSDQFRRIPGTPGSNPLFDVNARDLAGGFNDFKTE